MTTQFTPCESFEILRVENESLKTSLEDSEMNIAYLKKLLIEAERAMGHDKRCWRGLRMKIAEATK